MRIVIADELPLVRAGFRKLIESIAGIKAEVVADTGSGEELAELIVRLHPDVVLTEVNLLGLSGLAVCQQISRRFPTVQILFISQKDDSNTVRAAIHGGASGFLVKDAEVMELEMALKALEKRQRYISPKVSAFAMDRRGRNRNDGEGTLTTRQRQVLRLMAKGKSTKEIANLMELSVKTVETHRARMAQALGLYGVHALMCFAIKKGMDTGEMG